MEFSGVRFNTFHKSEGSADFERVQSCMSHKKINIELKKAKETREDSTFYIYEVFESGADGQYVLRPLPFIPYFHPLCLILARASSPFHLVPSVYTRT
jgi:hypothetical protein